MVKLKMGREMEEDFNSGRMDSLMRDAGKMMLLLGEEDSSIKMVNFMKEIGQMKWQMVMVNFIIKKEQFLKGILKMINKTAKGRKLGLMVLNILANTKMDLKVVKESLSGMKMSILKEILKIIK